MSADDAPLRVGPGERDWPLHDSATTRRLEAAGLASSAPQALMACAGLALARLALALSAPGQPCWVAAGPGNNGGDGLVAARWLHRWGQAVQVCLLADGERLPADARHALAQAQAAGVPINTALPSALPPQALLIDALLGLGGRRAPQGRLAEAVAVINRHPGPVLAVDLPTGLDADTGAAAEPTVQASHTLSLLTLKPGLFTHAGRQQAGQVWWHGLGRSEVLLTPPQAWLHAPRPAPPRPHHLHKGRCGDLLVLGGAAGMHGAALLAASAALTAGAGRVYLGLLDSDGAPDATAIRPELMRWPPAGQGTAEPARLAATTVVCGCGGGQAVAERLPAVLAHAPRLVLDADGLNAVAVDPALADALRARAARGQTSVLTPHPLEAARLLACTVADIQADRLTQAQRLAWHFDACVVLKGSGSIVAAPAQTPRVNPSGNARLATAGSGDVLAGWLGAALAAAAEPPTAQTLQQLCSDVVWLHGHAADRAAQRASARLPLRALDLINAMADAMGE